jgi:RNA polymerase sigma-70 factor (ECF subfamily)
MTDQWQCYIDGLRAGDEPIIQRFCAEYAKLLQRIAARRMPQALQQRVGSEDVVQSVFRSFFRRLQGGQFQVEDSESLWRLLCAITLTKAREQLRYHLRQKRGLDQEVALDPRAADQSGPDVSPAAQGPGPAEAAEFSDLFQQLVNSFDEEQRQILDLKLQQCTNEEIAERLGISERTVRRLMKLIRAQLQRRLAEHE